MPIRWVLSGVVLVIAEALVSSIGMLSRSCADDDAPVPP